MIITKELAYQLKCLCDVASTDESRPILITVHIEAQAERAFFVSADGFRLSAVCLPIETETEETITLQIDATMLKKLLKPKTINITPTSLNVSGASLSTLDVGRCFPDWRAIIPHNTEPRANMAAFMGKYSIEFLKFRLGKNYNKTIENYSGCSMGLPTFSFMHYSIYDGDKCGMAAPSAWAWSERYGGNHELDVVYYLHILMPISAMELAPVGSFDTEVTEERIEAFDKGSKQLAELLLERFSSKIKSVTGPLVDEVWGRPKEKSNAD